MSKALDASAYTAIDTSERQALPGAEATGAANPHQVLEITVKIKRKEALPEIDGRPTELLTRDQLAAAYGASRDDADKVIASLGKFGLKNTGVDLGTRSLTFTGTVEEMQNAFLVKLLNYKHPDGSYRGRTGFVHIPKELAGIVEGVFGLDNRRVARRKKNTAARVIDKTKAAAIPASWYTPAQLATHYSFPPGDGVGECVGILEFGGGYFPADLQQFCGLAGIDIPNVTPVSVDGTSTSAKDGAEGEVMLDIEVVAGICPKANIVVYFANFGEKGWVAAIDHAVQDKTNNPGVLSASWGYAESGAHVWTKQAMNAINEALKEAAMLGITVCIAGGDDGSSDAETRDGLAHVDFPASSPYVLAVGGTTIPKKGGTQPDIAWFEGTGLRASDGGSTGGGVSAIFPRPSWQSAINIASVNPGAIKGRVIPDLACNADWVASPYLLVVDGASQGNGGTSAAAPLIASLITLINASLNGRSRVGYLTPALYQPIPGAAGGAPIGSTCFTDVISGNNDTAKAGGYNAGPGFDAVSGWGTPIGTALAKAIALLPPAK